MMMMKNALLKLDPDDSGLSQSFIKPETVFELSDQQPATNYFCK